jgi:hypothetical protein
MAKRLTPIERAIAGEPPSRQRRYDASLPTKGLKRMSLIVPVGDVERVRKFAADLRRSAVATDASIRRDND